MKQPPVRELLASYLLKRQDQVLQRLLALIAEAPDLAEVRELAATREYNQAVSTLLQLLVQNIADPHDRRCFNYARQRAQERFRQNITATQMLRLAALHRQVLTRLVQRQFGDDPPQARRMVEIIDAQIGELEITFADAYQSARDRQWQVSETKYFSLFENASEAIISFRPGEGRIIEVNVQAERLIGMSRAHIMGQPLVHLFPEEHRAQVKWLVEQPGGSSNIRLEDMSVCRADGLSVPISLSCNWINVDGQAVAQAIMRDVTQMRQMQRELQDYAGQLEARVAERTRELQAGEKRFKELFLQEQRRARHLQLINQVQQCALGTDDMENFLHQAVAAIQGQFSECDVTCYLRADVRETYLPDRAAPAEGGGEAPPALENADAEHYLVAVAQTGGYGLAVPIGGRHPFDVGLVGQAAQNGTTLFTADDTVPPDEMATAPAPQSEADEVAEFEGARPLGVYRAARAEIAVPIFQDGLVIGVLGVQSETPHAFAADMFALETAAATIAAQLHSSRLFGEAKELGEFNETLINTMLHSLMVIDREFRIQIVNERLCQTLRRTRDELLDQLIGQVLGAQVLERHCLPEVLRDVIESGTPHELQEVHVWAGEATVVFDLRMSRVYFRGEARIVVLLINITQRWRKAHQRQMLNEMGRFFQASLDINRVLYTVLTCITAGSALGFNRAFLLLRDEGSSYLKGAMALGPSSSDEASRIWRELSARELTLPELLSRAENIDLNHPTPLQQRTLALRLDMGNPAFAPLAAAIRERRAFSVRRDELTAPRPMLDEEQQAARQAALELFTASELVIAPLVAKERIVGIVLADNLYSGMPVDPEDVQLLETVAQQAGLTIDNALTYQALQKAQKELITADRLAVVGEMAARVSHEIRNPLATIGGFARNILKRPDDTGGVVTKSGIIIDEVARLEELLNDLLDMARSRPLDLQVHSINELVEHGLLLAEADIRAAHVTVEKQLDAQLPAIHVDRRRLLQALLNTLRNGAQAMPEGGILTVMTRTMRSHDGAPRGVEIEIHDTGVGISAHAVKQIFDPFFSTKIQGSGLGLAVTRRIIQDHGGDIDVQSAPGEGTSFILRLPLEPAPPASFAGSDARNDAAHDKADPPPAASPRS